jgi:hypothetical protein
LCTRRYVGDFAIIFFGNSKTYIDARTHTWAAKAISYPGADIQGVSRSNLQHGRVDARRFHENLKPVNEQKAKAGEPAETSNWLLQISANPVEVKTSPAAFAQASRADWQVVGWA